MSLSSESEHRRKLNKIREDMTKRVNDVRDHFAKIEKIKVEALKKTEEMSKSATQDIAKLEVDIAKSDLASEIKKTLMSDITVVKKEIEDRIAELRNRISGTVVPS
jgi:phenylalanyl-tRNA synthetase alpha subunit